MNVLNCPKQIDRELIYSHHAINRAEERCVPLPKYLPLNSECTKVDLQNGKLYYHIDYTFNDVKYRMVVSEDEVIITVYPLESSMTSELMAQLKLEYYRKKAYMKLAKIYDQMYMPSKKTVHETLGQTLTYAGDVICTMRELKQYDSFFA